MYLQGPRGAMGNDGPSVSIWFNMHLNLCKIIVTVRVIFNVIKVLPMNLVSK